MWQGEVAKVLFGALWDTYLDRVPPARRYVELVAELGGQVINDHVAFRSLNVAMPTQPAGAEACIKLFTRLGYRQAGAYAFGATHLAAWHLEHADEALPKIFISQLEADDIDPKTAAMIRENVERADAKFADFAELMRAIEEGEEAEAPPEQVAGKLAGFFGRPWLPPARSAVEAVSRLSQYGAWTLLHGNAVNHFTSLINAQQIAAWPDIETTVQGLLDAGVPMKDSIEGAADSPLRQSSTQAARGKFAVTEADGSIGEIDWTYAYYEFAQRGEIVDPSGARRRFNGFLGEQTTGLFEMTRTGG